MKILFTLIALFTVAIGAEAQTFYEWKDGKYTERLISEVDSVTFSLPESMPKAIDLGLPSGTLWADRNIGADSPEDNGGYFAWGETWTKSTYNWGTYKWCNGTSGTLTKYSTNRAYGSVDNKSALETTDDVAIVTWSDMWCVPTYEELSELQNECTWTWVTQNDVNGYKVTGPNNNFIFIPAAGLYTDSGFGSGGTYGYYWLNSILKDIPTLALQLSINSNGNNIGSIYRYSGLSVRAVMKK